MASFRFRFAICITILFSLVSGLANPLVAQSLKTAEFQEGATKGFDHVYSLDYEDARSAFQNLRQRYPQHPGPPLYLALTLWQHELFRRQDLGVDRFVSPESFMQASGRQMSAEDRNAFFRYIGESQASCQAILKEKPGDRDARYFLGAAHGVLAAFAITIDHDKREAFRQGKKAYQYHLGIVMEQPDYYDAYVTLGLYEYIVANLPWYMKWIAQIAGYKGTEERGFNYLRLAVTKSQFVSVNARAILVVLCLREKMYDEALENAHFLHRQYPRNFQLHLNVARVFTEMNRPDQAADVYMKVIAQAEARTPNYQKIPLGAFRYNIGKALMNMDRLELAQSLFTAAIQDPTTAERERALSLLCLAEVLDLRGNRQQAIANYQQVLSVANFEDSHSTAQGYLKKPYRRVR
jgi:tetratricopeptide (TPR) repeat protein